jgi:hypothetical protein
MNFDEEAIKVVERIEAARNVPVDYFRESVDDDDPAYEIIADALQDVYEKGKQEGRRSANSSYAPYPRSMSHD